MPSESNLYNTIYNPDVLSCIANLSNDEMFTPPSVANAMLDICRLILLMFREKLSVFSDNDTTRSRNTSAMRAYHLSSK